MLAKVTVRSLPAMPPNCARGSVSIEFALIAPVLFIFILGVFDLSKGLILYQQIFNAAHTIPITASNLAVQPDKSTTLTPQQAEQAMSALFVEVPWLRTGVETGKKLVVMSSISFSLANASCVATPSSPCAYNANVAWSVPYWNNNNIPNMLVQSRPCGQQNQISPTAYTPGNLTSLPTANVSAPDPILVVDVYYRYTPLFFNFVTGHLDFWATGFWPVRSVAANTKPANQYTTFDLSNSLGGAWKCPPYD